MSNLISIIVPCYNQGDFLGDALQSVLDQSYNNWECIIVDDGSTDNSVLVAKKWCAKDERFLLISKNNEGVSASRNIGIRKSKGKYILPLDADDKLTSDYVKLALDYFENHSDVGIVYAKALLFGAKQGEWDVPDFDWKTFLTYNSIFCSGIFIRSDFDLTSGYDENLIYGLEDWEFWINLLNITGKKVYRLNFIGLNYRIKETSRNTDLKNNNLFMKQSLSYIYKKHSALYTNMWGTPIELAKEVERLREDNQRFNKLLNTFPVKLILKLHKRLSQQK